MNLTQFSRPCSHFGIIFEQEEGKRGIPLYQTWHIGTLSTDSSFFIEPAIAAPEFTKGPPSILSFPLCGQFDNSLVNFLIFDLKFLL